MMIHATDIQTMHPLAQVAMHAVDNRHAWGDYAARQYAAARGARSLYRLACQLDAATRAGFR